jgi:hypothetical protein
MESEFSALPARRVLPLKMIVDGAISRCDAQ